MKIEDEIKTFGEVQKWLILACVLGVVAALSLGCSVTVFKKDPLVEIVRALVPTPTPTPTPSALPVAIILPKLQFPTTPLDWPDTKVAPAFFRFGIEPCELRACDFWDPGCPMPPTGPCLDGESLGVSARDLKAALKRAEARAKAEAR